MHALDSEWLHFLTSNCSAAQITLRIIIRSAKFWPCASMREQSTRGTIRTKQSEQNRPCRLLMTMTPTSPAVIHLHGRFVCACTNVHAHDISLQNVKNMNKWSWIFHPSCPRLRAIANLSGRQPGCFVTSCDTLWTSCAQTEWNV